MALFRLDPEKLPGLERSLSYLLAAVPVLFNLVFLSPELLIGTYPLNDHALHFAASMRAGQSLASGLNPMDTWLPDVAGGYPMWRAYAPLPHFVTGLLMQISGHFLDPWSVFLGLHYLLCSFLPAAFYWLARSFGMGRFASALAAVFSIMLSGSGDYGRFALSYGAQVWRGSGLYPQLWGIWAGLFAFGAFARAMRGGRSWIAAGVALAIACLSHLIIGVVVILSVPILLLVMHDAPLRRRLDAACRALALCFLLSGFFLIPLVLDGGWINISRWESAWKWDSFGAESILLALVKGDLLDSGRWPILTLLFAAGTLITLWQSFSQRRIPPALAMAAFWLLLFFGRTTWGHLLKLAGIPQSMHLHRLQAAFEIFAVLLAGAAAAAILTRLRPHQTPARLAAAGVFLAGTLVPLFADRAAFLKQNTAWGVDNLVAHRNASPALEPILRHLQQSLQAHPGRVYAGLAAGWGGTFKIGSAPLYAILTTRGIPNVGFLFHSLTPLADPSVYLDDHNLADLYLFGIRYVLAPRSWQPPAGVQLVMNSGDYFLYEIPSAGLFDVVAVPHAFNGPLRQWFEPSRDWLRSPLRQMGRYLALYPGDVPPGRFARILPRWAPIPPPTPADTYPAGIVQKQWMDPSGGFHVTASASQNAYLLFRTGFHPNLRAESNGEVIEPVAVTPGMAAFPLPPGVHNLRVFYTAGPLKTALLLLGWLGAALLIAVSRPGGLAALSPSLAAAGQRAIHGLSDDFLPIPLRLPQAPRILASLRPHLIPLAVVLVLALLALRPTYRGQFPSGHDALEYPPRIVEFHENIRHGDLLPLWAKDLGNGFGQPLFQFVPPAFYWGAELFHLLGAGLTDSITLAALLFGLLAAFSCYGIGVQLGSRHAGVVIAAAFLFLPYLHVNLYVRGNFMEYTAMALLPFALWMLWRAAEDPTWRRVPLAAAAIALFLLSHNAITLFGLPVLAVTGLARYRHHRPRDFGYLLRWALSLTAGFGLSVWFLAPALVEKNYAHLDRLREGYLHFHNHFVYPRQLLYSAWGYGLSLPGTGDGMSYMIGPVHLLLAAAGGLAVWRGVFSSSVQKRVFLTLAACGGVTALLTTNLTRPIWNAAVTLQYVEFPWRALAVAGFCLAVCCGLALLPITDRRLRTAVAAVFVTLLVAANLTHARPQRFLTFDDEYYAPENIARLGMNTTTREEYEPLTVAARAPYFPLTVEALDCAPDFAAVATQPVRPQHRSWTLASSNACRVRLNLLAWPGWQLTLDGRPITPTTEPRHGRMLLSIPSGSHTLTADLGHTPLRVAARLVSLATLLALLALALWLRRPKPRQPEPLPAEAEPAGYLGILNLIAPDAPARLSQAPPSVAPIPPVLPQ